MTKLLVIVYKIGTTMTNGTSSVTSMRLAKIRLTAATISDVKFVDDENLILATAGEGDT